MYIKEEILKKELLKVFIDGTLSTDIRDSEKNDIIDMFIKEFIDKINTNNK